MVISIDSRSECYDMTYTFEDVEVKQNAPQLLKKPYKKSKAYIIGTGAMTYPYLPLEKTEGLTYRALEIIDRYGFGVTLITKGDLVCVIFTYCKT
ncbi:hypothetical protein [Anaerotignum sp.]|uniref:hypothetical protein n=1 Tax=Anaerotignum sp. TaxID=2039241 RepID=UPI002714E767|nr:hypothetical protein [Anaerotignum sp.]